VNGKVKVFIGDSNNWNRDKVVKVLVVFSEQVVVGLGSNQGDDSAEGKLNVGNGWCWFGEKE